MAGPVFTEIRERLASERLREWSREEMASLIAMLDAADRMAGEVECEHCGSKTPDDELCTMCSAKRAWQVVTGARAASAESGE